MPSTSGDGIVVDAYKETESSIVLGLVWRSSCLFQEEQEEERREDFVEEKE
jgi:hypothetical protein